MAESRRSRFAYLSAAAAIGVGASIAAGKVLARQQRSRPDPYADEPYGQLQADREYFVEAPDGLRLSVSEFGPENAKSGVVFLHGYCLDRSVWHHQLTGLNSRRLIAYDARHHGRSRIGGEPGVTMQTLSDDLGAVLEHSGLERVVICGHSMGGMTALDFCRRNAGELEDAIAGLILVNTTYTDAVKTMFAAEFLGPLERRARKMIDSILDAPSGSLLLRLRGDDLSWLIVRATGFGQDASAAQSEHVRSLLRVFPTPALIEILRALRDYDMTNSLSKIDVPSLIIGGESDRLTTLRGWRVMEKEMPQAELHVFEGVGHMGMMEKAVEVNQLITKFLDQHLPGRRKPKSAAT